MLKHIQSNHSKSNKEPTQYRWYTNNEHSGKIGIKWYCLDCQYMMVFPKSVDPNPEQLGKESSDV